MSGDSTRQLLLDSALRAFAEDGVHHASLLEITRDAGQRNRGAVHYHFGSRENLLVEVILRNAPSLAAREGELLEIARTRPEEDLESALEAIVRPAVELGETGAPGAQYLQIIGELISQDATTLPESVSAAMASTGGMPVYEVITARMLARVPQMPPEILGERLALATSFMINSAADRARAAFRDPPGRPQLPVEPFVVNLLSMTAAMLTAPLR